MDEFIEIVEAGPGAQARRVPVRHAAAPATRGTLKRRRPASAGLRSTRAAQALKDSLRLPDTAFSYLTSHGALDVGHTKFFETLVNRLQDPADREQVIHCARIFYRLYGDIFRALARETGVVPAITEAA